MEEFDKIYLNEEKSERVDRFLRNELSRKEKDDFLKDLKIDRELMDCYQRQFQLMRGIRFNKALDAIKKKEDELSYVKPAPARPVFQFRLAYASIAVAAALVGGVFIWDGNITRTVGSEYIENTLRSGGAVSSLVACEEYEKAIEEIDHQLSIQYEVSDDPNEVIAYNNAMNDLKFQKAIIYLRMGKKSKAKAILKEINDERSREVLDKLLW